MKYTYFPIARWAISYFTIEFNVHIGRHDYIIAEPTALLKASLHNQKIYFPEFY